MERGSGGWLAAEAERDFDLFRGTTDGGAPDTERGALEAVRFARGPGEVAAADTIADRGRTERKLAGEQGKQVFGSGVAKRFADFAERGHRQFGGRFERVEIVIPVAPATRVRLPASRGPTMIERCH